MCPFYVIMPILTTYTETPHKQKKHATLAGEVNIHVMYRILHCQYFTVRRKAFPLWFLTWWALQFHCNKLQGPCFCLNNVKSKNSSESWEEYEWRITYKSGHLGRATVISKTYRIKYILCFDALIGHANVFFLYRFNCFNIMAIKIR